MDSAKILNTAIIIGIALGIAGCFLPWAQLDSIHAPFFLWSGPETRTGIWIFLGIYALIGLVFTAAFQTIFMVTRQSDSALIALMGGIGALFCAGAWILNPGTLEVTTASYSALYGAYVTLLGTIIVTSALLLSVTLGAERTVLSVQKSQNAFKSNP